MDERVMSWFLLILVTCLLLKYPSGLLIHHLRYQARKSAITWQYHRALRC